MNRKKCVELRQEIVQLQRKLQGAVEERPFCTSNGKCTNTDVNHLVMYRHNHNGNTNGNNNLVKGKEKEDSMIIDTQQYQDKLNMLEQQNQCKICQIRKRSKIVLPCMHYCYCDVCIENLKQCKVCGASVVGWLKVKD